jgi:4a-hydroxytetrahydrobiopterin dehydratase
MSDLLAKRCIPCEGGTVPLFRPAAEKLLKQVNDWQLSGDAKKLSKTFKFVNFAEAMAFANKVAAIAEDQGHHPDLTIGWGRALIELSTHAIGGLSENDFILAAKIDEIAR